MTREHWAWVLAGGGACIAVFLAMRKAPGIGSNQDAAQPASVLVTVGDIINPILDWAREAREPLSFVLDPFTFQINTGVNGGVPAIPGFYIGDTNLHMPGLDFAYNPGDVNLSFPMNYLRLGDQYTTVEGGDVILVNSLTTQGAGCGCGCDENAKIAGGMVGSMLQNMWDMFTGPKNSDRVTDPLPPPSKPNVYSG